MKFGQYEVAEEIGRGGMGVVYRGFDPFIKRDVALKTIKLYDIADPAERRQMQERLEREAQSAGRLSHPNIVTIYQIGYTELQPGQTTAFIAMEYIAGRNLASLLEKIRPSSPEPILNILRQAAAALDYAHRQGVIHRDIKPANLLLTPDGTLKITDFGVAKIVSQTMTMTGAILGSPFYMSPEQIKAESIDGRTDQYSLGVVAYEIFGGVKPFHAETLSSLVYKIAHEEPPRLQLDTPGLADKLNPVLLRAMAKTAAARYDSCTAFIDALAESLKPEPAPVPPPIQSPIQPPAPVAANKLPLGWIAAGAALGLLGAGYFIFNSPDTTPPPVAQVERITPEPTTIPTAIPTSIPTLIPTPIPTAIAAPTPAPRPTRTAISTPAVAIVPAAKPTPLPTLVPTAIPTQPPKPAEPVRTPPRLLSQAPAAYTEEARRQGIEGIVILSVDIDESGIPRRARVVRSLDQGLDRKAIESVAQWRFAPGTLDGKPTPSNASVEVAFKLVGAPSRAPLTLKKPGEK